MAHNHDHGSSGNIGIAFILNFSFTILEIIGGIWTNSLAILSDAVHDLGDSFSLGLAWFLDRYSKRKPDLDYTFGYSRYSLLGALINTIVLIIGSVIVLSRAIPRIISPEHSNPRGMLIFAIIGIIVNGIAVLRLRGGKSLNEKVVSWHLLEDVLGWLAILIASIILFFKDIQILDPILSILITSYVLYNVFKNLFRILKVLLQRVPEDISIKEMEEKIIKIEDIDFIHHTHVWSLDGEHNFLSTHAVVSKHTGKQGQIEVKRKIKDIMRENNIHHVTVEIDFSDEDCVGEECRF